MAGTHIEVFPRQVFDFSWLAASADLTHAASSDIDVTPYRRGELVVRVHARAMTGSQLLEVKVVESAPSADDPAASFLGSDLASCVTFAASATPELVTAEFSAPFPASVRVCLRARQHTSAATFQVALSAELVMRARP